MVSLRNIQVLQTISNRPQDFNICIRLKVWSPDENVEYTTFHCSVTSSGFHGVLEICKMARVDIAGVDGFCAGFRCCNLHSLS